jgi:hypothetical protein
MKRTREDQNDKTMIDTSANDGSKNFDLSKFFKAPDEFSTEDYVSFDPIFIP